MPVDTLSMAEEGRLAEGWKPQGPDGAIARALLALTRKDAAAVDEHLAGAESHPLAPWIKKSANAIRPGRDEDAARKAWAAIAELAKNDDLSTTQAKELFDKLVEFEKRHGKSAFASTVDDEVTRLRGKLSHLEQK